MPRSAAERMPSSEPANDEKKVSQRKKTGQSSETSGKAARSQWIKDEALNLIEEGREETEGVEIREKTEGLQIQDRELEEIDETEAKIIEEAKRAPVQELAERDLTEISETKAREIEQEKKAPVRRIAESELEEIEDLSDEAEEEDPEVEPGDMREIGEAEAQKIERGKKAIIEAEKGRRMTGVDVLGAARLERKFGSGEVASAARRASEREAQAIRKVQAELASQAVEDLVREDEAENALPRFSTSEQHPAQPAPRSIFARLRARLPKWLGGK